MCLNELFWFTDTFLFSFQAEWFKKLMIMSSVCNEKTFILLNLTGFKLLNVNLQVSS